MKLERPTEIIWSSIAQSVQWLGYRLHKQRNKVKFPVQAFLHQSVQKPGAEILYSQQYYYLTPGGVCSLRIYQLWCEASSILEAWFWVCSGVRLVLGFGFVALLGIIISFKTFSSFLGSLRNPQWWKISKYVYIYFCFGPIFFCARTNLSPVPWMGKELFLRDSSHTSEADQWTPPTAVVNLCTYTPTLLHFFMVRGLT